MIEYTYHYCAQYNVATTQNSGTLDGIVSIKRAITNYEHYSELKDYLAKQHQVDRKTLVIISLSKIS